jgi:hypothetical protein
MAHFWGWSPRISTTAGGGTHKYVKLSGKLFDNLAISINSNALERVSAFTFLGVTIDEHLDWKAHIHKISCKVARTIGVLSRVKHLLPQIILKTIYNSLILPYLNYCLLCWGPINTSRLLLLQKKAIRCITCANYNAHCDPIFKSLNLLKIDDIFLSRLLKFYYQRQRN